MMDESLGADSMPEKKEISAIGGDKKLAGAALRSPAFASFEILESPDADEEFGIDTESGEELDAIVKEYESTIISFEEGQIVSGRISEIREAEIIVDVGFKSEGSIPAREFRNVDSVNIGDQFDVYLEKLENQDGLVVLSKEKADFFKVWDEIKEAHENGAVMQGVVKRRIKGGLVVDLMAVNAFLPGSQIALRQVPNLDDLIGETLEFKIIKINKRRRNIVISRRVVLEEQREEQKRTLLSDLEVGEVRKGTVKNITDFGAFVDLGGVDGLLHLTDLTWGRVGHPSDVVEIGEELEVKVLDFDKEREKISLGLKQLTPYPWDGVEERYPVGARVEGQVVSITDYGAFVELEKGVEGLIHISEMSWTKHVKHPSKIVTARQNVETVVLKVDQENQKISLGLKQTEPDPWTTIEQKYPVGTHITGIVRNLTNFGAFVEIEEGIDGLLHISDMSWAKRVRHPNEVVKKGETIEVVVLDISQDKKRISLGMKQLTDNPWDDLADEYSADTDTEGTITRILDRGAVVELRSDVEGFVPIGQMGFENLKHPEDRFTAGDVVPMRVIKVDPKNKRIVLSISAFLRKLSESETEEFMERFPHKERVATPSDEDAGQEETAYSSDETDGDANSVAAVPETEPVETEAPAESADAAETAAEPAEETHDVTDSPDAKVEAAPEEPVVEETVLADEPVEAAPETDLPETAPEPVVETDPAEPVDDDTVKTEETAETAEPEEPEETGPEDPEKKTE